VARAAGPALRLPTTDPDVARLTHPSLRLLLPLALACAPGITTPAVGQTPWAVGVRVGAVGSSDLVRDSIVEPFAVRPQVAPLLGLRAIFPVGDRYLLGAQLAVSRSDLRTVTDTAEATVTALTVWAPSLVLRTSFLPWLAAEARLGALLYDPATPEGTLFSDGSPVAPMLGLGFALERPLNERFRAALFLDYDAHRFTTTTLGERGFTGATIVHRVAVGLSLTREFGHAAP
jgi:hypothetical protein